jgi:hypothetical protein
MCAAPDSNLLGDRFDSALRIGSLTQGEEGELLNYCSTRLRLAVPTVIDLTDFMAQSFLSFAATNI